MRLHHYPGLFGDPRSRGLPLAVGVSLVVHVALFATAGRLHTRPTERTFFAPVHIVDLVERAPGPGAKPAARTAASTPPAAPAPAARPPKAAAPSPAAPKAAAPPAVAPRATAQRPPKITSETVQRLLAKATEPPPTVPSAPATEAQISQRIARMREKYGGAPPAQPAATTADGATDGRRVEDAIASIRQKVGPGAGSTGGGTEPTVGVRGGGTNTLQQVRLRAYYNQLWDHVTTHWAIPPSLKGLDYTVIVSVIFDRRGKLIRSWVEEASGSEAFDQSALRALQRAQPLPSFPDSVSGETLEVGFRFHPD